MKLILLASLSWWPIAIGAILIVAAALLRLRAPRGPRCRGHRPRGWRLLSTNAWFRDCGYDLTRLPVGEHDLVRCPECAACTPAAAIARRPRRRWPLARLSIAIIILSAVAHIVFWVRCGDWTRQLSDTALIRTRQWLGSSTPSALRFELLNRINACPPTLSASALQEVVPLVIDELRDDDISANAEAAVTALEGPLWGYSNRALYETLGSTDWQQRQIVANILVRRGDPPSPDLLRVLVEALRDDTLPSGVGLRYSYTRIYNAQAAVGYLTANAAEAEPLLVDAMNSPDWQQRFLAAVILGAGHRYELAERAAPILIEHLDRNAIDEDAKGAVVGLVGFDVAAIPHLDAAAAGSDPQRAALARVVRRRIAANTARHTVGPPAPDSPLAKAEAKEPHAAITALGDATLLAPGNLHMPSRR
ncbi:MAG: hypothetical protein ACREJO_12605 [Phycisphaerales bacterium]